MDTDAVRIANQRLWAAHPELKGRQLSAGPKDAALRAEWMRYYKDASVASAPPPAVTPKPVPPPPPLSPVTISCPATNTVLFTNDCKDIKKTVREGDIVLRAERGQGQSDALAKISRCDYSHAGIVAKNDKGELVVVDAFPGRGGKLSTGGSKSNAVRAISVDSFFCDEYGATHGMVGRPKDCAAASKAAAWALEQTKDPDYVFDLWDPWNVDPKRLYCADFVYQAFGDTGTAAKMVPKKMDLLSKENEANTIAAIRKLKSIPDSVSDDWIKKELLKNSKGKSEYITPCQIGVNTETDTVLKFDSAMEIIKAAEN
jgi:hypothetical protein